ncbi:MAG: amidohydrolase family protein [candidate division FCPU426 bacterium]
MLKRFIIRARALAGDEEPLEDKLVVISGRRIENILPSSAAGRFSPKSFIGAQRYLVLPGLVDIHCHGGGGADTSTLGGLLAASYFHASQGTTAMLLSVFFRDLDDLARQAELLQEARQQAPLRLLGLHLEGPYLNPEARGSIPADVVRPVDLDELDAILEAGLGEIRVMTVAPELPGAEDVVRKLRSEGVVAALGHSLATAEQAHAAAEWGATLVTHLGNAMRPFHQRDPGLVGAALADPRLTAEVIADGVHLAPEALSMFLRGKVGELILVSDCRWVAGLPDGEYTQPKVETLKVEQGLARQADGTIAGGVYPLWRGVTVAADMPKMTIFNAVRMATRNPARLLRHKGLGRIGVNGLADLVLAGPDLSIRRVFVRGVEIFRAPGEPPLPE